MKDKQLRYQEDPLKFDFKAQLVRTVLTADKRTGVILDQTYFYPTGGGQEHDTGTLGEARVIDIYKDEEQGVTVHILDRELPLGTYPAHIDAARRLRHMQHHTAQHLLTQCFVRLFAWETLSANINGYSPSTLDLDTEQVAKDQLTRAEALANEIIYENRQVKSYFIEPENIASVPLRKAPPAVEHIRIIEIDGYDYSACGGTHCLQTGTIGVVKILKAERQNDKVRIHFIAGQQALEHYQACYEITSGLAAQLSVGSQELIQAVQRQAEQLKVAQRELQTLLNEKLSLEALHIAVNADALPGYRLALAAFENRPIPELRILADTLKTTPDLITLLATYDGQKISLVVTCGANTGISAQELLRRQVAPINGRGGGDPSIAQGGGSATPEQYQAFFASTPSIIQQMKTLS
ncbi:MAG: hypothetical protein JW726_19965 [Anaerolineales bacterium]|nr:hypothetical protein [Anaerolineales bacterium]